jgi:DUF4097 and DUF4098 domain-containing protein YvlB
MRWLVLFLGSVLAVRAIDREAVRTFPVAGDAQLKVEIASGSITVEEHDAPEIKVTTYVDFKTDAEDQAARLEATLNLSVTADGSTVTIRAQNPGGRRVQLNLKEETPVEVECRITVPRRCSVDLATREGPITVGSLSGRMVVRTIRGNIFLRRIDGTIDARAQTGDVTISRCSGAVVASTVQGSIHAGTLGGRAEFKSANGEIEILAARGGLEVSAESGDVIVGFPRQRSGEARVRTGYGNILATIDPAANCVVQASSFWGKVQSTLPLTVETGGDGKSQLTGRLNQGGPRLTLSASGGNVKVKPGEPGVD